MLHRPAFVLVHSPLVGPLSWEPTAKSLRRKGHLVLVPALGGGTDGGPPYYRKLARRVTSAVTEACPGSPVVLPGQSGAGALLPAIADEVDVHAAIFVDAILPHPGLSWFDTAPAELRQHLLELAHGALLPRWNEWFPADALSALLPEASRKGWPVRRENADHLAMLTRPDQMADVLDQLGCALSGW